MIEEALGMLVNVVTNTNARPILVEIVPDNLDRKVSDDTGAGFIGAPQSLVFQFADDPGPPFLPRPETHKDIAEGIMQALGFEMRLGQPTVGRATSPGRTPKARSAPNAARFMSQHGSPASAGSARGGPFDGTWYHQQMPGMKEVIEGNNIRSSDGVQTFMVHVSHDTFYIEQDGQRIHAKLTGNLLRWDDGDVWCLEDKGQTGTLDQLRDAWAQAERAVRHTVDEERKEELRKEHERLHAECQQHELKRAQLEEDARLLLSKS